MNIKIISITAAAAMLAGCSTVPGEGRKDLSPAPTAAEVTAPPQGKCPVWIYRTNTSFHALNPERPYVYVNDVQISTLGVGATFCLNLKPGKYEVAIREPILFIPANKSGELVVDVAPGGTQYIRYSREMGGVKIYSPTAVGMGSVKNLDFASQEAWDGRF